MIRVQGCDSHSSRWAELNEITQRLANCDPTIWGHEAQAEASIRLGWVSLPESSRDLLPQLDALSAWSRERGHSHFILCGMGGSSLAPEVIAATYGKKLIVLDSTEPNQVWSARQTDLKSSCIIIGSKSGSTIETASHKSFFIQALHDEGLEPADHMVIVTDPGSPLDKSSREEGLRVINANPNVGGRFSALSAFGLVPAALIGVDVSLLLDDAYDAAREFVGEDSSVVKMASYLAQFRYVAFSDAGSACIGLSDWIEQLIAESTGKNGVGVLPVVVAESDSNSIPTITFTEAGKLAVVGPLGAQFIFWEWVTALLGYLLNVDPFNQPNVTESKERTLEILQGWAAREELAPTFEDSQFAIYSDFKASTPSDFLRRFLTNVNEDGYIALMAYLDRIGESELAAIRKNIADYSGRPTTFGWGPRFLHSTGQFHKGGPLVGSFVQITVESSRQLPIPQQGFGFERLVMAQALGDGVALRSRNLPFMRIHIKDRKTGLPTLIELVRELATS